MEVGEKKSGCMAFLDKENAEGCGTSAPLTMEQGRTIIIASGYGPHASKRLPEQSEGGEIRKDKKRSAAWCGAV